MEASVRSMTEGTIPDTTIHEPSMTGSEVGRHAALCAGPTAADNSPEELYGLWCGAVERSRVAIAAVLADGGLDQPAKFTTRARESPNLRRMLIDLHDEYARHVGHADLLREAVDGLVGEDPPQT